MQHDFAIAADHPCLDGHFPGAPVVPGVVVLDRVMDAFQVEFAAPVVGVLRCKFVAALYPGERCAVEFSLDADAARFVCHGPGGPIAKGVLSLAGPGDG